MKKILIKLLILILIVQMSFNLIDTLIHSSKAATTIYLKVGESTTLSASSTNYTVGDSSIAGVTQGLVAKAQRGTNSAYTGTVVNLDDCKYTWADSGRGNGTYYATKGSVYLYIYYNRNTPYVNNTQVSPLTVENDNGNFKIHYQTSDYLSFNTSNNYFTATNSASTNTPVNLYRKATSGETSSTEIPGYVKVTAIEYGAEYLVVKENNGTYYLLYPQQRNNSNYDETARIFTEAGYTITGLTEGTTTVTIGSEEYTVIVYEEEEDLELSDAFIDKGLIITMGLTYTMQTQTDSTVTWSSDNTSVATVSTAGLVTPVAAGSTTINATIEGVTFHLPVTVMASLVSGNNRYRTINIHVETDGETTTYFNYNQGVDFIEARDGTRVYMRTPRTNPALNFYAKPKSGYAVSYMSGWYGAVVEETEAEVRAGNGPNILKTVESGSNTTVKADAVAAAYELGAEGIFGYVASANVTQTLTAASEKLPQISQTLYSVNGNLYQSGDDVYPGDTVIFEVTVSKASYEYIVNYNGTLTNSLSGAVFLGTSPTGTGNATTQAVTMNTTDAVTQKYYVKYTIPSNATGSITNQVDFDYVSYPRTSASSSTGAVDSAASYETERSDSTSTTVPLSVIIAKTHISLTKSVTGNMRETDRYFKFLVNINGASGDVYTISGQDSTVTYNGASINTNSTYTVGSTNYVYLKHGQTITIGLATNGTTNEIPVGITYSITEQDAEDYSTTITGIQGMTKTTGTLTLIDGTNLVAYINSNDRAALTGVFLNGRAYTVVLIVSSLALITIAIKKYK